MKYKYIWLFTLLIGLLSCEENESPIPEQIVLPELTSGSVDFSNYVALGASFTAGFTDGGLFIASQENSFPNILSQQFANVDGGTFTQPLMNDNIGGLIFGSTVVANPRLYFDGLGPAILPAAPTTDISVNLGAVFNNVGIPGAKSTHIDFNGYATLNPYFGRMATSSSISMLEYTIAQNPTFFTLSEIGGNDVLGYATSGAESDETSDDYDPITPVATFDFVFNDMVDQLLATGAKGVLTNVPYITDLPHFTTVPHNPLDPSNPDFGPQIPTLNATFAGLNMAYAFLQMPERSIVFSETEASPVIIHDESLPNIAVTLAQVLQGGPNPLDPLTAGLLANQFGQSRQATAEDLLVLPSSSVIATLNQPYFDLLVSQNVPPAFAGQLALNGVTFPLEDKWVLLPSEQDELKTATDAYNSSIAAIVSSNENIALVDLNAILSQLASTGINFDGFNLNADLVTGGAISLDGIHLTARGYAFMANKFLEAIDNEFGTNFITSGNVAKANDYPTNYSPILQ